MLESAICLIIITALRLHHNVFHMPKIEKELGTRTIGLLWSRTHPKDDALSQRQYQLLAMQA